MVDLWQLIRTERRDLIELLETLDDDEWAVPSLCGAWTVQDVAAHVAWAPVMPPRAAAVALARAGFSINAMIADSAVQWSTRGRSAILDQLRSNLAGDAKPFGMPPVAALADAVVHPLDISRPLDRPRPIPLAAFAATADFFTGASSRWPMNIPLGGSASRRIAGLRLVADDLDWSRGQGPEVLGAAEALMLVLTGRPVEPTELTGPGAPELYSRLSRGQR